MTLDTVRILVVGVGEDYAGWMELARQGRGSDRSRRGAGGGGGGGLTESDAAFDLIICDWLMPEMDGLTFLKRFRENVSSSMFLLLTAKSGLEDVFEATQAGATNYLVKPLTVEELQQQVVSMLH